MNKGKLNSLVNKYRGKVKVGVVMADHHAPYYDKKLVLLVNKFINALKPDEIIFNGDMLNYAIYSRHGKRNNESEYEQVNEDHTACNIMLDQLIPSYKPNLVWIDGNHDTWQDLYFTENPDYYDESIHRYNKLQLKKRGFKTILPYGIPYKSGKLNFIHGHRGGINAVRNHLIMDYHANFVMGHIHRSDTATSGNIEGKVMQGYSVGCMCKLDWKYTKSKSANHGIGVYYIMPNGNFTYFNIVIVNYQFLFGGQLWSL